jgi:hypothetical protein
MISNPEHRYNPTDFEPYLIDVEELSTNGHPYHEHAGDLPTIDLQALKISAWLKYLIHVSIDPDYQGKHASRSEAVFKATRELINAGIDDLTIMSVMLDARYTISQKPLEKGRQWLAGELARAHAKLNGHQRTSRGERETEASDDEPGPADEPGDEDGGQDGSAPHDDDPQQGHSHGQQTQQVRLIRSGRGQIIACQHNTLAWLEASGYGPKVHMDTLKLCAGDGGGRHTGPWRSPGPRRHPRRRPCHPHPRRRRPPHDAPTSAARRSGAWMS